MDQPKVSRRFRPGSDFSKNLSGSYFLLPFRFRSLVDGTELLVNDLGDFLFVPEGSVNKIVNKKLDRDSDEDSELWKDLVAGGFITETSIPSTVDVMATRYRTKKLFLHSFTSLHIFVISLRCEHSCHYCQVSRVSEDKNAFDMSREVLDKGIDLMFRSPNPRLTMEFQGGEALLAFSEIRYAVDKSKALAQQLGKEISFVICTNLALVNDEVLDYCKDNGILISTSLDGPKFVHDQNRHKPGASSYDLTIRGIEKARAVLGDDSVSALMTTTSLSLDYPIEIVDEYVRQGFPGIVLRSVSPYGFALRGRQNKYETSRFIEFYKKALGHIIQLNFDGTRFTEDFARILLTKILTPFDPGLVDLQSPAGLVNSVVVFNYDGSVYATDESRMLAEQNDFQFKLGSVHDSYEDLMFGSKVQEISEVWANECLAGCSDCVFQTYCGADPVFHWSTQGDMYGFRPTSDFCHKHMAIIEHLFNLMQSSPRVRRLFESWVA